MALILIVDDVDAMRKALSLFVSNAGHEAIQASSGEEALELARKRSPDLIVADILMPGMDGFEFARQLRADPAAGKAHIVFHSAAYSEEDACRLARDCGVFNVVQKPAKPEVILNAIEAALKSPPPVFQPKSLAEFAREHQRLVSDKLVEKVAALEATNERADELHRSNEALEHFASIAAHDFEAPLNTVIGYMQRLSRLPDSRRDADAAEAMDAVLKATTHMQQFVRDILAYSRLGGATLPLKAMESSIAVKRAVDNLGADIHSSGVSITCDTLPAVYADATQLTQLFQNLIHNAIKFCSGEKREVHVLAATVDGECVFSVKDSGIGIAPADSERVFNLFTRLNSQEKYSGSGIGLAVCKRIVARHGGRIWIESALGQGTTIYFTLRPSTRIVAESETPIENKLREESLEAVHS